jgi:tellurite resistance protein
MFVEVLSEAEHQVFVSLARALVAADGEVHAKEAAAFARVTRLAPLEALPEGGVVGVPDGLFVSQASRVALLLELCGIAASDGEVSADEREILDEVAVSLESAPGVLDELLAYAEELTTLLDRGIAFMAEGVS